MVSSLFLKDVYFKTPLIVNAGDFDVCVKYKTKRERLVGLTSNNNQYNQYNYGYKYNHSQNKHANIKLDLLSVDFDLKYHHIFENV